MLVTYGSDGSCRDLRKVEAGRYIESSTTLVRYKVEYRKLYKSWVAEITDLHTGEKLYATHSTLRGTIAKADEEKRAHSRANS